MHAVLSPSTYSGPVSLTLFSSYQVCAHTGISPQGRIKMYPSNSIARMIWNVITHTLFSRKQTCACAQIGAISNVYLTTQKGIYNSKI